MPVVRCGRCGEAISRVVTDSPVSATFTPAVGQDLLPVGHLIVSDGHWFSETKGSLLVNIQDGLNLVPHPDPGRWNGCCGADGQDGVNMLCPCGSEVATKMADCWMYHALVFEPDLVAVS